MTRERAIELIGSMKGDLCDFYDYDDLTALEMAISALSENKGDLISRQAVENITWEEPSYSDPLNVLTEIREKVRALPSVENKGEWIKYSFPRCGEQHYQCTSCGYYINFGQWGELYTKEFKFCPNCGAKMKGGEE